MRIIAVKTLKSYWEEFPQAKQALLSWYEEAEAVTWNHPNELKAQYRSASIITNKRVVFNIHGNSYRLIVDIEYGLKIIFVVWFGTHKQYDNINAEKVSYAKTDKNDQQYEEALAQAYSLMQQEIALGSPEADELEVLSMLIKAYEQEHYPVPKPHPIEAIKFRLEQVNMSEAELAGILGYRSRKSEILSGKKKTELDNDSQTKRSAAHTSRSINTILLMLPDAFAE